MKVCKKCKKRVPNNMIICKYCGADLSKVKKNKAQVTTPKTITKIEKEVVEEFIPEVKAKENVKNPKTEYLFTQDYKAKVINKNNKNKKLNNKIISKNNNEQKKELINRNPKTEYLFTQDYKNKSINKVVSGKKMKVKKENLKKFQFDLLKKRKEKQAELELKKKHIKEQLETFFNDEYILDADIPDLLFAEKFKVSKEPKKRLISIKDFKSNFTNKKNKDPLKKKKKKIDKKSIKKKKIVQKKQKKIVVAENYTKLQQLKNYKKQQRRKKALTVSIIIIIVVASSYFGYKYFMANIKFGTTITEQNRYEQHNFGIGDIITYKDINYSIIKVETSQGTKYRRPKDGNQYLIITINFENKSDKKYKYSADDWKMFDSLEEESGRIITPVNAKTALYSGYLVVGGTKTASIVFEEPIDDENLILRYYNPKEMEKFIKEKEEFLNSEEAKEMSEEELKIIDEKYPKPVFDVSIKVDKKG